MHLIRSSAFLHMCGCGLHAHLVYSDQSSGKEFGSREVGLNIVELDLKDERLSKEEGCAVIEQIMRCALPTERGLVDETIDELYAAQDTLGSMGIEIFLSTSRPTGDSIRHQDQLES